MSDGSEHVTPLIKMISESMERKANERLAEYNITFSQMRLLGVLYSMENKECRLKELEKHFSFSATAVAGVVNRLEAKEYVQGFVCESDKRIKCVRMLPNGEQVVCKAQSEIKEFEEELFNSFTPDEKVVLLSALTKVYEKMV